nr:integrase, catalytic region, zinc finger, CCHC-type, peptidase aspartic, catalytic [Tanacetum cinerariifolium]
EIESLKHTLSEYLKEKESLEQKITILKDDFQKEESRNIDSELALEKEVKELHNIVFKRNQSAQTVHMLTKPQVFYNHATRKAIGFQNPRYLKKAQQLKPNLYNGSVIGKSDVIVVPDSKNTLMHAEESQSKMIEKQNDPQMIETKVITKPIDYAILNQLSTDFNTRQHCAEKTKFQTKMENVLKENDRLLTQALSVEIVNIVVHDYVNVECLNVDACVHCVTIESEFKPDFIKKECYETLLQKYNTLEKHCITLEEKVLVITALKEQLNRLKGKANRTAHIDYIRHTQEEAATLREIVERERLLSPLNTSLVYALAVIPKNKTKQIRHTAQVTKSENIIVTTPTLTNLESNKPVLSSIGVNLVSSASGSLSQDNIKKNRIRRTQKHAKKNKVDHLRSVKSSLNKESVVDSKATSSVINSMKNVNSDLKCASCNGGCPNRPLDSATISSVGQFGDSDLEVAFCQHTCFIRNLDGVDLLTGSRGNNLYTLSIQDMMASSPICLL